MPLDPLIVPQSDLNKIMQSVGNLQAAVFRSTSLFKKKPKTRQMVIEPLFEVDYRILMDHIKDVFPEERIEVEKSWRRIRINLDDVTFK